MLAKDRVVVSKLWITGYWLWSRLSYICDCCKSMKNCRDWVFSLCGLEVGLPAFQLPMFEKCDSLPKKRFVRHVCLRNPCLLRNLSLQSLPEAWGHWERQHAPPALHYGCIMPISSLNLQNKTCLMQRSRLMPVTVKFRLDFIWRFVVASCDVGPMFPCNKSHSAMKNCRDWVFSLCGLEVGRPAFQLPMFEKCDSLPRRDVFDMFV